jgi:hypothetical protein
LRIVALEAIVKHFSPSEILLEIVLYFNCDLTASQDVIKDTFKIVCVDGVVVVEIVVGV